MSDEIAIGTDIPVTIKFGKVEVALGSVKEELPWSLQVVVDHNVRLAKQVDRLLAEIEQKDEMIEALQKGRATPEEEEPKGKKRGK